MQTVRYLHRCVLQLPTAYSCIEMGSLTGLHWRLVRHRVCCDEKLRLPGRLSIDYSGFSGDPCMTMCHPNG